MSTTRRSLLLSAAAATTLISPSARAEIAVPVKLWEGFASPVGMGFDAAGDLYVAEWSAVRVSRIASDGRCSVFAEGLSGPSGLAIGADVTIYVASYSRDEVYRFTPQGERSVHVTGLATPAGLSFDRAGRLLIANRRTNQILAVTGSNGLEPVVDGLRTPVGAVQTHDGGFVVANIGGGVTIVRPDGRRVEAGGAFRTRGPGVVQARGGRVFVVDYVGTTIREILMDGSSRIVADGPAEPGRPRAFGGRRLPSHRDLGEGAIHRITIPS